MLSQAVRQEEGTDRCTNLYIVREGKCFGHEGFLQNEGGNPPGKVGMRALADCSIFLLTDKKIANLVRNGQPERVCTLLIAVRLRTQFLFGIPLVFFLHLLSGNVYE